MPRRGTLRRRLHACTPFRQPPSPARKIAPYEAKIEAGAGLVEAAAEAMHGLTEADRLAIALVALSNRERVTFIEMLKNGIASPGVVRALVRNADALAEAAGS